MSFDQITPDQIAGAEFLAARRVGMLGDKAGFGKSAQFVLACEFVHARRVTIVCPPILRHNEAAEFAKWGIANWQCQVIRPGDTKRKSWSLIGDGVAIVAYSLVRSDKKLRRQLIKRGCDVLILDEAHALKDPKAGQTKAIFAADGLAQSAARGWFVTGTPTPNNAAEWYVFAKASGAWTGTHNQFVETYCNLIDTPFGPRIVGVKNEIQLKAMLAPHVLARQKIDPERAPLTVDEIPVDGALPDFSDVPADALEAIEAALAAGDWRALDGPAVATVRRHIGLAKAEAIADLAAYEIANTDEKLLIFCQHTAVIEALAAKLGTAAGVINGATPQAQRERLLSQFQHGSGLRALICQQQALREGVTLTAATRVFLAEPPWTPDACEQLIARAWRRGQSRHVRASFVYLIGSFDQQVAATLARKSRDLAKMSLATTL